MSDSALKLAGMINEEITVPQAQRILRAVGIDPVHLSDAQVKKVITGIPRSEALNIVAAYRRVRQAPEHPDLPEFTNKWSKPKWANQEKPVRNRDAPIWAMNASNWKIRKEDFTDINYIRKYMWEASGKPTNKPITIWSFDGVNLNTHIAVLAKANVYPAMAKAMLIYTKNRSKAIFMSALSNKLVLIWLNGRLLEHPEALKHNSPNRNPSNDWGFIGGLPKVLADMQRSYELSHDDSIGDFKARINIETHKVITFETKES